MANVMSDAERLVRAAYRGVLRREADPEGLAYYVQQLEARRLTPGRMVEAMTESEEFQNSMRVKLFMPPGHFYSPVNDPAAITSHFQRPTADLMRPSLPGIALDPEELRSFWHELLPLMHSAPFTAMAKDGLRYRYLNHAYSYADGSILHAMIRHFRPRRFIEVGSGWSSACSLDTIELFLDDPCAITFIEPYPELLLDLIGEMSENITLMPHGVQDVPVSTFEELEAGDILFIDSTHVLKTGSDVWYELSEVLPRVRPGVVVHLHDMFWPFEYPVPWALEENRSWNEVYAVRAFLTQNPNWKILFFNDYFARFESELIRGTYPKFLDNTGGALWLLRV